MGASPIYRERNSTLLDYVAIDSPLDHLPKSSHWEQQKLDDKARLV